MPGNSQGVQSVNSGVESGESLVFDNLGEGRAMVHLIVVDVVLRSSFSLSGRMLQASGASNGRVLINSLRRDASRVVRSAEA